MSILWDTAVMKYLALVKYTSLTVNIPDVELKRRILDLLLYWHGVDTIYHVPLHKLNYLCPF